MRGILPTILAILTRKDRYLPEIEWSDNSWTHNAFRAFEWLFGRRKGVRVEASSWVSKDKNGKVVCRQTFYTLEAVLAFTEGWIRGRLPKFGTVRVYVPALALAGVPSQAPFSIKIPYLLAVAYDTAGSASGDTLTSGSVNLTISGSNRLLMGGTSSRGTNSTFTYNSVALTARSSATNTDTAKLFSLVSPPTGTNSLAASFSIANWSFGAISLTGAGTIGTDVTATGTSSATLVSVPSATDAMVVDIVAHGAGGSPPTATGVNTARWAVGSATIDDGGMSTAAGAGTNREMRWNGGASSVWAQVGANISPADPGPGNLKSYDGNLRANIKSAMGNLIANMKSLNGNS